MHSAKSSETGHIVCDSGSGSGFVRVEESIATCPIAFKLTNL